MILLSDISVYQHGPVLSVSQCDVGWCDCSESTARSFYLLSKQRHCGNQLGPCRRLVEKPSCRPRRILPASHRLTKYFTRRNIYSGCHKSVVSDAKRRRSCSVLPVLHYRHFTWFVSIICMTEILNII